MLTRTLSGVIVLMAVGMIAGAGLCLFDNDHDPTAQLDLCSLFFSAVNLTLLTIVLDAMSSTLAVFVSSPTLIALDLPTPPPKLRRF